MPMTKEALGAAMQGAIDALSDDQKKDRKAVFEAMAGAIIEHIQLNMVITLQPTAIGLQSVVSLGAPTGPPVAPIPLSLAAGNVIIS